MKKAALLLPTLLLLACTGADPEASTTTGGSGGAAGAPAGGSAGSGGSSTGGAGGGMSTGGGPAESVTLLAEPCEKSPNLATKCERYEVTCGGAAPAVVDIAFYEPAMPKGAMIVFGSGGDGTGFYNFAQTKKLLDAGYTVVDRRWPDGWFTGATEGPQQAACRLAAVLRHLRGVAPRGYSLCSTGNSGGSAELGYALTWQGAGQALDFAMPTSGPFHRLDLACQGASDAAWPAECAALKDATCPDCASNQCQLGAGPRTLIDISFGGVPRCTAPAAGDLDLLKQRSPDAGPDFPAVGGVPVLFLIGKDDGGAYEPLATALHDSLGMGGASVEIQYVTGAPHEMDTTPEGADAIATALLDRCPLTAP